MPQTALFTLTDLGAWLRQDVTDQSATVVEKVVWGWLGPVLKLAERPDEVSEALFSWAVELGGIAFSNPEGLSSYQLEDEQSQYSSERRDEILRLAAGGGVVPAGGVPSPRGSFPRGRHYPDPAERGLPGCW